MASPRRPKPPRATGALRARSRARSAAARARFEQARDELGSLASTIEVIAGEIGARGPGELEALDRGLRIGRSLQRWRRESAALAGALRARRGAFTRSQLRSLGIGRAADRGLKLHLGAAGSSLPGWLSIDHWPADLAMDLRWGLPFARGSAELVYLCHVLEHFYYPQEALAVLQDIHRVLGRGGIARIVVPDIGACLHAYVRNDRRFFAARRTFWPWWPKSLTRLEDFLRYAGVGASPESFTSSHKFGYDFETLRRLLRRAGFRRIERSAYMQSRRHELRIDNASRVAGASYGNRYYSLFVEARA
jgi:predicted SAM-dependent methyltransferase